MKNPKKMFTTPEEEREFYLLHTNGRYNAGVRLLKEMLVRDHR